MIEDVSGKLDKLPSGPGVYLFRDQAEKVIYVGKANNLRSRVRSYFGRSDDSRPAARLLQDRAYSFETIVTNSETEALLLENQLIKKHQPRYNIRLRDDKDFVSLRLTVGAKWPMLQVVRRPAPDENALTFGPYGRAGAVRSTLDFLKRNFPLRTCSDHVLASRTRPCLEYQIKRCVAPCVGYVTEEEYGELVKQVELFLRGKNTELVLELEEDMRKAAEDEQFERAAGLRNRLFAVRRMQEENKLFSHDGEDRDVFGLWREGDRGVVQVLTLRNGRMLESRGFAFREVADEDGLLLSSFIAQYYGDHRVPPDEVLIPLSVEDEPTLTDYLASVRTGRVALHLPLRGEKADLIALAVANAKTEFTRLADREASALDDLEALAEVLKLPQVPERIECVDLSTISGTSAVGAVVAFVKGQPAKELYRHYKIRDESVPSDYAFLNEVLSRRFQRALKAADGETDGLPDLLVIDGGRGQVSTAVQVMEELGIPQLPIVGISKGRDDDGRVLRGRALTAATQRAEDHVFVPGRVNPVSFRHARGALFLLQRLRDEAHRFAITFHRDTRKKQMLRSPLDEIAGVGPARRKALLAHFGSLKALRGASVDEIAKLPGISRTLAETIHARLTIAETRQE